MAFPQARASQAPLTLMAAAIVYHLKDESHCFTIPQVTGINGLVDLDFGWWGARPLNGAVVVRQWGIYASGRSEP